MSAKKDFINESSITTVFLHRKCSFDWPNPVSGTSDMTDYQLVEVSQISPAALIPGDS